MDFEVDFLPVGEASRAGDAIVIRYRDGDGFRIIVVDGGTDASGNALVKHIEAYNGPHVYIDHVVSTHPDSDHACGLRAVLQSFAVGKLWIHPIWDHADEMLPYFRDKRFTALGLANAIRDAYPVVDELLKLAVANGTEIWDPFQGSQIGPLTVLSPSRWSYLRLVPQFRKTPEADTVALETDRMLLGASGRRKGVFAAVADAIQAWVAETWNVELLREGAVTAAENETSTVLFGRFGEQTILLTADAGVAGLTWASDYAASHGYGLPPSTLIQVPHHGSRSNVTPSVLNRLIGFPVSADQMQPLQAVVSCPKDDSSHPRKMVLNAFRRRGVRVLSTNGIALQFHSGTMPGRGWEQAEAYPWFGSVEAYD